MTPNQGAASLVERLQKRAEAARTIQANNEAVAEALKPQMDAFDRRDGSHNTFAVRLYLDHRDCAKNDAALAADWDEAASTLSALEAERDNLLAWFDGLTPNEMHDSIVRLKARAEAAEAENARLRIEVEAAKLFGGGFFGSMPTEATREHYRKQARAALTQDKPS